ncbi:MAG: enoyl-CoA hydratase/isomerase family protein, partial [Bifidobacteriaceae bacterium]|nr:enoyl-CoA hydratase/isomerase family protein [Bifidobacteriaceae bacterium]
MSLITYEADGQVATLIINRPEALNALNADLLAALGAALDRAEASECRCLVLTGAGRAFVAGADLPAMAELTPAEAREFSEQGNALFLRLQRSPVPSIAAVNGYALGGGLELALACDLRIASVKAKFALPEVSLGVIPGFGGTQRLARLVGPGFAAEMLLTGSQVDAAKA